MHDTRVGQRIMQRLRELDRTRGWLARQMGKDESTVHRWVDGSRNPGDDDLRDMALVLHRSVAWLDGLEEPAEAIA